MTTTEAVKMEEARTLEFTCAEEQEIQEMRERFVSEMKILFKAKNEWRVEVNKIFNCGCGSGRKHSGYFEADFLSRSDFVNDFDDKYFDDKCMVCEARRAKLRVLLSAQIEAGEICNRIADKLSLDYRQSQDGPTIWAYADGPMAGKVFYREPR